MMNIKINLAIIAIFASITITSAQDVTLTNDYTERNVKIFDASGKPFANPNIDVEGTPYFIEEWKRGSVRLNNDTIYNNVPIRVELQNQEIHFLSTKNVEMIIDPAIVKEIILFDSVKNEKIQYSFQCGFPSVDNQTEKNFYLVLSDGKLKFIESMRKKIFEIKKDMSGEKNKEFRMYEDYYFFFNNKIQPIRRNKEYLLGIMKDNENKIEDFVKNNRLSYKSIDDIKKIVVYYNLL